jgi:hypothetical protein
MRKRCVLLIAFMAFQTCLMAQATMKDLFNGNAKLTFMGFDFSQARFIGSDGFTDPIAMKNQYIPSWNSIFTSEYEKYSLQKSFKLPYEKYTTNVDNNMQLNKDISVNERIIDDNSYIISEEQVKKAVAKYAHKDKNGIGLTYVVESFNKNLKKAFIWVTFVDLSTNKVLLTQKMEAAAGGFGFKNYWASTATKIKKQIDSKYYSKWQKDFR